MRRPHHATIWRIVLVACLTLTASRAVADVVVPSDDVSTRVGAIDGAEKLKLDF